MAFRMKATQTRLQLNPFALAQNAENFAEAGRTKALPKWYPAAQLFPPHLLPLRTVIPSETGQYVDPTKKNTDCTAFVLDGRRRRWSDKKTAKSYWRNHPQYVHFPKVIEYPEDDLRRRFYKYHPFELKRPIHLMEKDDTSNVERDWSTIWGGNIPVKQMTGECVIKHTMYLMTRKVTPLDTETAYQTALQAFYQAQREQEYAQLQRRKEAYRRIKTQRDKTRKSERAAAAEKSKAKETAVDDTDQLVNVGTRTGKSEASVSEQQEERQRVVEDIQRELDEEEQLKIERPWAYRFYKYEEAELEKSDSFAKAKVAERTQIKMNQQRAAMFELKNLNTSAALNQ